MIEPQSSRAPLLLLVGALAPLAGCTTGKTFSIAMTNPGATTVLIVGDADPGDHSSVATAATSSGVATPGAIESGQRASLVGKTALLLTQEPTALVNVRSALSDGAVNAVVAATGGGNVASAIGVGLSAPPPTSAPVGAPSLSTTAAVTTPVISTAIAVSPRSGASTQVLTPVAAVATTTTPSQIVQLSVTSPTVISSSPVATAGINLASSGASAQIGTAVASATIVTGPTQGLQASVTSAVSAPVAASAIGVAASAQAALAGVGATLSAPTPGAPSSAAAMSKALANLVKLKRG